MTTKLPAKLRSTLTKHCPFETTSMRMIQRVCALYLGHSGGITREGLFSLCETAGLDELSNFRPNFTMNMKKDEAFFKLDKHPKAWSLTTEGKAEAKRVFDNNEAPSTQPSRAGAKKKVPAKKKAKAAPKKKKAPKAKKKAAPKKKAAAKKKTAKKAPKKKATPKAAAPKDAKAKARLKKKRQLANASAPPKASTPAPAAVGAKSDNSATDDDW